MDPADKAKTTFATRQGLFEFNVMPFGLSCATFECLMENILQGLQWDICLVYLDDITVTGKTFEEILDNPSRVFNSLQAANL